MYRGHNKKNLTISLILLLILAIGIGYAYLTSNLSIAGNTNVATNSWNIHFENLNATTGSVIATNPAIINSNNTSITYTIDLNRPKEFYEFTVDVKNDGTLPGKVSISTLNGITTEAQSIIDYSVTYTNGNPVSIGDILNAGAKKTIKVRVFYKDEINPSDFPANDLNLTLTYTLQYVQSEKDEISTETIVQDLINNNTSCFTKYEGNVTDKVGITESSTKVYFNKCDNKGHVIFNNMCWQMIRTTETGGIKILYNGEAVDGKCLSTRGDHKGIVGSDGFAPIDDFTGEYLYGDSFTYDVSTGIFTLVDTTLSAWSSSTYLNLMGKFTCKNTSVTCTTIYNVSSYESINVPFVATYTIDDTEYTKIGTSPFNASYRGLTMIGYMFNKIYNLKSGAPTSGSLMGNDVSYFNGTYTLLPANGESTLGTTKDDTHHYTCNTTSSTCSKVRYYYDNNGYIELKGAANIDEALNEMLYDNANKYNSSIKGIVDSWYAQNLSSKTNMLEDTVFCNARNMTNQGTNGWSKDGSLTTSATLKNNDVTIDITCQNISDQFSVSNNKAKLRYPVALLQEEERNNVYSTSLINILGGYWELSPYLIYSATPGYRIATSNGIVDNYNRVDYSSGVRPVISLKNGIPISSGTGTASDPWVIE